MQAHELEALINRLNPVRGSAQRFKLGQPYARIPRNDWDIFAGESEVEPALDGDASSYLWWQPEAELLFQHTAPPLFFPARFGGDIFELQNILAERQVSFRMDWKKNNSRYYHEGTVVLGPTPYESDLARLHAAMAHLTELDVVALGCAGSTRSDGWTSVSESESSKRQTAVFWHTQSQEAIDRFGNIEAGTSMYLYWRGDQDLLCNGLRKFGLLIERPSSEDIAIVVRTAGTPPPVIPDFDAAVSQLPKRGAPRVRARVHLHPGWKMYSTPLTEPVDCLSVSPHRPLITATTYCGFEIHTINLERDELRTLRGEWSFGLLNMLLWWDATTLLCTASASIEAQEKDGYALVKIKLDEALSNFERTDVFKVKRSHFGVPPYAIHPDRKRIALLTSTGVELRRLDWDQPPPEPRKSTVFVRKKNPKHDAQTPWHRFFLLPLEADFDQAYARVYFSPDGETLLWVTSSVLVGIRTSDGSEKFRFSLRSRRLPNAESSSDATFVRFSPRSPLVFIGLRDREHEKKFGALALDLHSGTQVDDFDFLRDSTLTALTLSDDGSLIVTGHDDGRVVAYESDYRSKRLEETISKFRITEATFQTGSHLCVVGDRKGRIFCRYL